MSPVVEARGLSRHYPGDGAAVRAVDSVDLVVERGEAVSVMGPSGCGKSTLLHVLGGSTAFPNQPGLACAGAASVLCSRPSTWSTS